MTWAGGSSWQLGPSSQHATLWLLLICCHRGTPFMFEKYLPPSTHSSHFLGFCRGKYWKNIWPSSHSLRFNGFLDKIVKKIFAALLTFFTFQWIFVQESLLRKKIYGLVRWHDNRFEVNWRPKPTLVLRWISKFFLSARKSMHECLYTSEAH